MTDYQFWNKRWIDGQIGFHQNAPHPSLVEFAQLFAGHEKIFVPLCGKSLDMIYLRDLGHQVIGVEFSEKAITEFISENNLTLKKRKHESFNVFEGEGFCLYQGDLFCLGNHELSGVSACYDRASMVALNLEQRQNYSRFLLETAKDLSLILAPLLDYGKIEESLPPFSVTRQELQTLYSPSFLIEELKSIDVPLRDSLRERGALYEREVTYKFYRSL